jgi:hypothetical protein
MLSFGAFKADGVFVDHLVRCIKLKITPTGRVPRFPMGQTGSQDREAGWDLPAHGVRLFEETSQIRCGDSHQIPNWEARQPRIHIRITGPGGFLSS